MEHSTSTPNERVWRITQFAKLSFNHPSVVLTADVLHFFYKIILSYRVRIILIYIENPWTSDRATFPLASRSTSSEKPPVGRQRPAHFFFLISALFCKILRAYRVVMRIFRNILFRAAGSWYFECSEFKPTSFKHWMQQVRSDLLAILHSSATHLCAYTYVLITVRPIVRSFNVNLDKSANE